MTIFTVDLTGQIRIPEAPVADEITVRVYLEKQQITN